MKTNTFFLPVIVVALALTTLGCASSGMFPSAHMTEVQLRQNNFKIVARDVSGESQSGYLLGATYSLGVITNTVAIARVNGTGMLYKEALENLWKNYEAMHGSVEGKNLALTNVRYDSDVLNLIIYTQAKISVRADIVEFTE